MPSESKTTVVDAIEARAMVGAGNGSAVLSVADFARLIGIARAVEAEERARRDTLAVTVTGNMVGATRVYSDAIACRRRVQMALATNDLADLDAALKG